MSYIDDWTWKIIRACGLSTANSDINVFKLEQYIKQMVEEQQFKEFAVGKYVLRFYKTDHVWTCTMTEDMLDSVLKVANPVVEDWDAPTILGDGK